MSTTLLRLPSVKNKTGHSRSSIYAMMANGSFPSSITLGKRSVAWIESEVDAWIEERIKKSRAKGESHAQ